MSLILSRQTSKAGAVARAAARAPRTSAAAFVFDGPVAASSSPGKERRGAEQLEDVVFGGLEVPKQTDGLYAPKRRRVG